MAAEDYVSVEAVRYMLSNRARVAAKACDACIMEEEPEQNGAYEKGKQDAYMDSLAWLIEYTKPFN